MFECQQELQKQKCLITAQAIKTKYTGDDEQDHSLTTAFEYHIKNMEALLGADKVRYYHTTLA